jgi:4-hydroxythreonine-4-phosphate dehydrogenase
MAAESAPPARRPITLALTQGDPAGVGPEILLKALRLEDASAFQPILLAERVGLEALKPSLPEFPWDRLHYVSTWPAGGPLPEGSVPVLDPVASRRAIVLGSSGAADAAGAMAALDAGIDLVQAGAADALVTAPVSKESIARHVRADFRGHTDYLAERCGLERYGRDYLMAFLSPDLQVALLTVHLSLRQALDGITAEAVLEALATLQRHVGGRIALAGLNPHAGEGGLLGSEEIEILVPVVAAARQRGIDVVGPESADSLFARARRREFDWVLALYHDQGLVAVKTISFGQATNWTLGLPILRTSVDHGTAFAIAGSGAADAGPMEAVIESTLKLIAGELPLRRG